MELLLFVVMLFLIIWIAGFIASMVALGVLGTSKTRWATAAAVVLLFLIWSD